ncbi:MAG: hypothetical protein EOO47_14900 [Flavobacterium sp.]|nr:MAG: hypothetical protein EOO47_14900 [Flavobacterium sp.]
MTKLVLSPENCYLLPFEEGTWKLSLLTLNAHTSHRRSKATYWYVENRIISYENEILTMGVIAERDGEEEKIYLKVSHQHLQVSCSVDTTSKYLSYHAYCCLERMMSYHKFIDFEVYYWPDFFNQKTGRSKFLTIINDRMGLDISLKSNYNRFYKPGEFLIQDLQPQNLPLNYKELPREVSPLVLDDEVLSFFVTKKFQLFKQYISLPFLLGYEGRLKKDKSAVKQYRTLITDSVEVANLLNPLQQQLMGYVKEMLPLDDKAFHIVNGSAQSSWPEEVNQLFDTWQKAWPLVCIQPFLKCYLLGRTENYKIKPYRNWIQNIQPSLLVPQLCVICNMRNDYLEISLCVKVHGKLHHIVYADYLFFVQDEHRNFYLLGSLQDVALVQWFKAYGFCFSALKCHYKDELLVFLNQLEAVYEVRYKKKL